MTVKAVKSFSGERFNMHAGEVREVNDSETVRELLRIGYLENAGGAGGEKSPVGAGLALPESPAPDKTEDNSGGANTTPAVNVPAKVEGLNETKRGKSKRN